jgi:ubiquinol-cytochrome c reductase cytochrome b subunit
LSGRPERARAERPVRAWLERRTGFGAFLARHTTQFLVPEESGRGLSLGVVLVFALALQIATGALLLIHFVPAPEHAFDSVRALMRQVPYGWFVRLVHVHGANLMVAAVFVHLFATAFRGAYKAPRELVWITGCALLLLVLGAALTGYILPWSQMSYWATTVVTASLSYAPFAGDALVEFVRGGEVVGASTYRRAFAAHVSLIPLALLLLVAAHLALVRRAGLAERPRRRRDRGEPRLVPYFPRVALRHALAVVAFQLLLFGCVFFAPNFFFPAEHLVAADPFDTPPNVKPEWYFLWAYQLPRMMPEALALALQGVAVAVLFALPFLDRGPARHPLDRPLFTLLLAAGVALLLVLSVLGYLA